MTVLPILSTYSQLRHQVWRVLNLIASERDCGKLFWTTVQSDGTVGLSLNKPLGEADMPVGTEIWKVG
jgi:hypothetical protein